MGNVLEISKAMKERNWVYIVGLIFQNNLKALLIVILEVLFWHYSVSWNII